MMADDAVAEETFTVTVKGVTYKCACVSGCRLMNSMGKGEKSGDMFVEVMLYSIIEPKFTRKELQNLPPNIFIPLGTEIMAHHDFGILGLGQPDFSGTSKTM
jgi:hypothetical protein